MSFPLPIYKLPSTASTEVSPKSPERPNHLAARSITELSPDTVPKSHRHHHHDHPHLRHRSREAHLKDQGAFSEQGSKSEGATPHDSRNASRHGSIFGWDDGVGSRKERAVKEGEVQEERERGVLRATELRHALTALNTLSNDTTRRLDNTYYAVLEKLSILQNTIASMKELANLTRGINQEFQTEAAEIVNDINGQLEGFEGFEEQEIRIKSLQRRVDNGREKIKVLAKRVDVVKGRVNGWEKAEQEWQDKTRKRLRILWILISICGALILGVAAFQYTPTSTQTQAAPTGVNATGLLGIMPDIEALKNQTRPVMKETGGRELDVLKHKESTLADDPRLRIFDEL